MRRVFPAILAVLLVLTACGGSGGDGVARSRFLLDTIVTVTVYDAGEQAAEGALDLCAGYEKIFSATDPESELYRLNRREIRTVSGELAEVIALGLHWAERTGGAFDITAGGLTALWDFKAEAPSVPDGEALARQLAHVGYEKVILEGNTVSFTDPETRLDLGGIAKGYIADRVADYLRGEGVASATIDLGGNLYCLGTKPGGEPFRVGIQYPYEDRTQVIGGLTAQDCSVVTSGLYERCFTVDGRLYHHILDLETGLPVENELLSVTIVSERSAEGDALSTACFALGLEAGMALVRETEGVEAVFITDDFQLHVTQGLEGRFIS